MEETLRVRTNEHGAGENRATLVKHRLNNQAHSRRLQAETGESEEQQSASKLNPPKTKYYDRSARRGTSEVDSRTQTCVL